VQLTPNEQRILVYKRTSTRYLAFVDNDVTVESGWLTFLLECAEETGAGIVGPLYMENVRGKDLIHMFGGEIRRRDADGNPCFREVHHFAHKPLEALGDARTRQETELVEFHAILIRTQMLMEVGAFDPQLYCTAEHSDLCIRAREAGWKIMLEPRSIITYEIPQKLDREDRRHFGLRWSEAWSRASVARISEKFGVPIDHPDLRARLNWTSIHRQRALLPLSTLRKVPNDRAHRFLLRVAKAFEVRLNRRSYPARQYARPVEARAGAKR
jgi:GT2 family glycosyltransferase